MKDFSTNFSGPRLPTYQGKAYEVFRNNPVIRVVRTFPRKYASRPIRAGDWCSWEPVADAYQEEYAGKNWKETHHVVTLEAPADHFTDMQTGTRAGETLVYLGPPTEVKEALADPRPELQTKSPWRGESLSPTMDEIEAEEFTRATHREEDFDEGDILERIQAFAPYKLIKFPISRLRLNEWSVDEWKVDEIKDQIKNENKYIPILIADYGKGGLVTVIDGTHRANAVREIGETYIWAYVGQPKRNKREKKIKWNPDWGPKPNLGPPTEVEEALADPPPVVYHVAVNGWDGGDLKSLISREGVTKADKIAQERWPDFDGYVASGEADNVHAFDTKEDAVDFQREFGGDILAINTRQSGYEWSKDHEGFWQTHHVFKNSISHANIEEALADLPPPPAYHQTVQKPASAALDPAKEIVVTTLVGEAGGEGEEGMKLVMQAIINRAHDNPSKFALVALRPSQFSMWNDVTVEKKVKLADQVRAYQKSKKWSPRVWSMAREIVNKAYANPAMFSADVPVGVSSATHYHTTKVKPYWAPSMKYLGQVGTHKFYKEGLAKKIVDRLLG